MKTILCLTDYTPSSKIAWGIAQQFSDRLNYRIVLVHVEPADNIEYQSDSLSKLHEFSKENRFATIDGVAFLGCTCFLFGFSFE